MKVRVTTEIELDDHLIAAGESSSGGVIESGNEVVITDNGGPGEGSGITRAPALIVKAKGDIFPKIATANAENREVKGVIRITRLVVNDNPVIEMPQKLKSFLIGAGANFISGSRSAPGSPVFVLRVSQQTRPFDSKSGKYLLPTNKNITSVFVEYEGGRYLEDTIVPDTLTELVLDY